MSSFGKHQGTRMHTNGRTADRILVAGEALIDMLPRERDGEQVLKPVPGGSPFNVALALGRLGVPVGFLCRISRDAFGERLVETLREGGVGLEWCPRTDALSTLGFVTLDPGGHGARYAFYTRDTAGSALAPGDLPVPLPGAVAALHVGSFALAIEPFGTTVEALVGEHAGERVVSYDPNIRPFLIPDRERLLARHRAIAARADLIKMSEDDLEWLHPGMPVDVAASEYLEGRTGLVVVTRGGEGASLFSREHFVDCEPPEVTVVDTVGAGDTFQAALLCWLHEHGRLTRSGLAGLSYAELQSMADFAARAAASNCAREGCQPPWRREL